MSVAEWLHERSRASRTRSQLTPITDPQTASARLRRSGFCIRALCEFFPITSRTRNPMIPALTLTNIVFTYPAHRSRCLTASTSLRTRMDRRARRQRHRQDDAGQARDRPALARCRAHIADSEPPAYRLLPAEHRRNTGESGDFACDWSPQAMEIRRELGIGDDWPWRPGTLSDGEAKRLQIACALATIPTCWCWTSRRTT